MKFTSNLKKLLHLDNQIGRKAKFIFKLVLISALIPVTSNIVCQTSGTLSQSGLVNEKIPLRILITDTTINKISILSSFKKMEMDITKIDTIIQISFPEIGYYNFFVEFFRNNKLVKYNKHSIEIKSKWSERIISLVIFVAGQISAFFIAVLFERYRHKKENDRNLKNSIFIIIESVAELRDNLTNEEVILKDYINIMELSFHKAFLYEPKLEEIYEKIKKLIDNHNNTLNYLETAKELDRIKESLEAIYKNKRRF